eukprot:CAMPEP_0173465010 /NCGR_PEP_ID=MMETSP1357-20121228/70937_1 /TAXON_ID=77926 /ORGANISM="Hemiselmis rufescens, Strain PCC563" /LENGTH=45 /DNA_ID= /DNA_START= /DNA_END= /DNA_ORIENTATION=
MSNGRWDAAFNSSSLPQSSALHPTSADCTTPSEAFTEPAKESTFC